VVGIPGRIVYRGGERVEPLDHARLPDSEAQVIRALVDRIEALEQQLETLKSQQDLHKALEGCHKELVAVNYVDSCRLSDLVINEFLDGAGI
jgi:serine O-acetyltransferase